MVCGYYSCRERCVGLRLYLCAKSGVTGLLCHVAWDQIDEESKMRCSSLESTKELYTCIMTSFDEYVKIRLESIYVFISVKLMGLSIGGMLQWLEMSRERSNAPFCR